MRYSTVKMLDCTYSCICVDSFIGLQNNIKILLAVLKTLATYTATATSTTTTTAAVGQAYMAPTQMIATPCGLELPLLPHRRRVQSLVGLSTLYLSNACVVFFGDGALVVPSRAGGEASVFGACG